jgi:molecular chaperone Hsp33
LNSAYVAQFTADAKPRNHTQMTTVSKLAWDDMVLPFQLDRTSVRGRVVRLDKTIDRILSQHSYPAPVQALIADAVLLTALVGQTIKLRWKLSLQIRGNGPVRLIATDYFAPGDEGDIAQIRAYAAYDENYQTSDDPFADLGDGVFGIIIDQGPDMQPYQGITPLTGGSLAACASTYFAQSEQLPTQFVLGAALSTQAGEAEAWRAGGIMVQHLAKPGEAAQSGAIAPADGLLDASDVLDGDDAEDWNRTVLLLNTTELTELIGPHVGTSDLLHRLFHEETPRVFDSQPIEFGCSCSAEKFEATLRTYAAADMDKLRHEDGTVTADCKFCGAHYDFGNNI